MSARPEPGAKAAAVDGRSSGALRRELREAAVEWEAAPAVVLLAVMLVAARSVDVFE